MPAITEWSAAKFQALHLERLRHQCLVLYEQDRGRSHNTSMKPEAFDAAGISIFTYYVNVDDSYTEEDSRRETIGSRQDTRRDPARWPPCSFRAA
jgi:hypothetical protein